MTRWSVSAMLLLGIAFGPYGLELFSPAVLSLLDPGVAMALAMLGVFVGLSVEPRQLVTVPVLSASVVRTAAVVAAVAAAVLVTMHYFDASPRQWWVVTILLGASAAATEGAADLRIDDIVAIGVAALVLAALRDGDAAGALLQTGAVVSIAALVAYAAWLLVSQTDIEAEQHVFVVGSLLLAGGAAAYLGMSALFAGLGAGIVWSLAGNVGKARINRDLAYFQHPLVVLVLVIAGASATLSLETCALAAVVIAAGAIARPVGVWLAARVSDVRSGADAPVAGLIGLAIALDSFRAVQAQPFAGTIIGTAVIAVIGSNVLGMSWRPAAADTSTETSGAIPAGRDA